MLIHTIIELLFSPQFELTSEKIIVLSLILLSARKKEEVTLFKVSSPNFAYG